jgi:hypothetical protein
MGYDGGMEPDSIAIGIGELCRRLDVPYRHMRYVLERGILPAGVDRSPDRGNHRLITAAQAFWLGVVLKLKQSGLRAPLAGKIADFTVEGLRGIAQNLNWEWPFAPHLGRLRTDNQWYVDIGDLRYVRIVTSASPSNTSGLEEFPWFLIGKRKTIEGVAPVVTIRLDVALLGRLLLG